MPSFDVVSKVDLMEVDNAVNQTRKEISTRYDFQGTHTTVELGPDKASVLLKSETEGRLEAALGRGELLPHGRRLLREGVRPRQEDEQRGEGRSFLQHRGLSGVESVQAE